MGHKMTIINIKTGIKLHIKFIQKLKIRIIGNYNRQALKIPTSSNTNKKIKRRI